MNKESLSCRAEFHDEISLLPVHIYRNLYFDRVSVAYMFVAWFENLEFPKADMKRSADQASIRLPYNYNIYAPA